MSDDELAFREPPPRSKFSSEEKSALGLVGDGHGDSEGDLERRKMDNRLGDVDTVR